MSTEVANPAVENAVSRKSSRTVPGDHAVTAELRRVAAAVGLPLMAYDLRTGGVVAVTDCDLLPVVPPDLVWQCVQARKSRILNTPSGVSYFAIPLKDADGTCVAVGYALSRPGLRPTDLVLYAADHGWDTDRLDEWLGKVPHIQPHLLERLVTLAARDLEMSGDPSPDREDASRIAAQLETTYEEINLLHTLTQNMHISRSPREMAVLSLERLSTVIAAEGHAVWLDDLRDGRQFLIEGRLPFDEIGMARLVARFDGHSWPRPLVRNQVVGTLLGADFPGLRNFVLAMIADGNHRAGWILSSNLHDGDFGTVQTSLLSSVASILGTHQRNLDLYREHEDLLLCFVRSLVSTLDAKDPYTRGHSERVALISRRLGAELGLPDDDLRDIHLSGLLHDIGKIGVDDQVLRKPGQLTAAEFEHIKKHPVIGYNILAGLKNLHPILPGVRHHHEAYNGTGYPDRLAGESIPFMARIMAVADSYDAMGSDRPYRKGLGLDRIEEVLQSGAGGQWDPRVVAAYFAVRDDIKRICEQHALSDGEGLSSTSADGALQSLIAEGNPAATIENVRSALQTVAGM